MRSKEEEYREPAAACDGAANEPPFSRYLLRARAEAAEYRLKSSRLRSDTMTILEKSRHNIVEALILIGQVDRLLCRDEGFLRGGYANRVLLSMLPEIRE